MSSMNPGGDVARLIAGMTEEERNRTLRDLLMQRQTAGGDDVRKIEDAVLLLRLRPKVKVTTYIPLTRRYAERLQDRKVWDLGIIDPLADEDIPGRPQIVRVEVFPPPEEGPEVLFERETVLGMPGTAEPIHLRVPPVQQRRMQRPSAQDLDEGSLAGVPPTANSNPMVAGVQLTGLSGDDFEDQATDTAQPHDDDGPTTVPVDPSVLTELMNRLESLEAENTRLREQAQAKPEAEPEADTPGAKARARRQGKPVRESMPGVKDAAAVHPEGKPLPSDADADKQPEPVG